MSVSPPKLTLAPRPDVAAAAPNPSATPLSADELYDEYAPYVARIAYRLLGNHAEVDDVVQDVFVVAWRGLAAIREPRAVKGWLATVTVRNARRRLRRARLFAFFGYERDDVEDFSERADAGALSPEDSALAGQVYAILQMLPVEERLAWTVRHVEGATLEEVAVYCDCSLATAKRRIGAAHAKVSKVLSW